MTESQQKHVLRLIRQFGSEGYIKYEKGCHEHETEGNLWDLPADVLIENLMAEILDLWMYAATLREKLLAQKQPRP